jgi:lysophospholipase L1-like esterase
MSSPGVWVVVVSRAGRLATASAVAAIVLLVATAPVHAATISPACAAANAALGRANTAVTATKAIVSKAKRAVAKAGHAVTKAKRTHSKRKLATARAALTKAQTRLVTARAAAVTAKKTRASAAATQVSACTVKSEPRGGLYVALGDSITRGVCCGQPTDPAQTYVGRVYAHYRTTLGVTEESNLAKDGESAASIRTSGQLTSALAAINAPTNTRVVTIGIGGYEMAFGGCAFGADPCAATLRTNVAATLADLQHALAGDPGDEVFTVLAYPNVGLALGQGPATEIKELGSDHVIACTGTGAQLGLDDVLAQEAAAHGALLANPYATFTAASISSGDTSFHLHPNATGHQQIADAFLAAKAPCAAR